MHKLDESINNPFEQGLVDNGYKFFKAAWKSAIRGFQKRFDDDKGIKYYITGYHYNHNKQLHRPDIEDIDSYTFEVQFRINEEEKDQLVDINFHADFLPNKYKKVTTLQEVEEFYEKVFITLNAGYYELREY